MVSHWERVRYLDLQFTEKFLLLVVCSYSVFEIVHHVFEDNILDEFVCISLGIVEVL